MIDLLILGLGLAILAGLGVLALDVLVRRAEVGAALLLASAVVHAVFVSNIPSVILAGDTQVVITDVVSTLVLGAGMARLLRLRRFTAYQRWLLLLGVLLVVSLVRGMAALGIQASVNDFRQFLFFAGAALYFATFPWSSRVYDQIGRIWLLMTIPMMILVCLRWLALFAGIDVGVPMEKFGNDAAIRVIDGPYVFFLGHAAVLTIPAWQVRDDRSRWVRVFSVLLLLFVMVLNRRTVWLAMLVGLAVLMLRNRRLGRRAIWLILGGAIITVGLFAALSGNDTGREPATQSASRMDTLTWRVEGWSELLTSWSENPANRFVGQPFGSGYARKVEGSETTSHPHSFYIETMLRTGAIGLLALIAVTAGPLRALWPMPARDANLLAPGVVPALLTMQLIWFMTWVPGYEQGIITGLALALAARVRVRATSSNAAPAGVPGRSGGRTVLTPQRGLLFGSIRQKG